MLKNNKFIHNLLISIPVISFLFFWDLKYDYFQVKFLFLCLIVLLFHKSYQNKVCSNNFFFIFTFLIIFITTHLIINLFIDNKIIIFENLIKIFFLFLIFFITYYFYEEIIRNTYLIICLFLIFFFLSCLISIIFFRPDNPHFCGGIYNYFEFLTPSDVPKNRIYDLKLSFKEFFFQENSHLGMVAPSIIIYSIFRIFEKKNNFFFILSTFLFLLICLIKSSTTFLFGTIFSLFFLIIFNFKKIPKRINVIFFIIIIIFSSILISDKECKTRFFAPDKNYSFNITNNIFTNLNGTEVVSSMTFEVYRKSLVVLKNSILERPFGWGFERYESAFDDFHYKHLLNQDLISGINKKDSGSNFVKLVVEFGAFSIIFFLLLICYSRSNLISMKEKCFFLPFLITQLFRGAGYFNGGFILIVFLIFFRYLNKNNLENK